MPCSAWNPRARRPWRISTVRRPGSPCGSGTSRTWTGRRGLYLEDLYVTPQARNRGVGRLLMAHAAATALARGCARMDWSVLDWNAPAVAMYRSLGAVAQDEWTVQRLEGAALARLAAFACPPSGGEAGTG